MLDIIDTSVCNEQGRCFEAACREKHLNERDFVEKFMQSDIAAEMDSGYSQYKWGGPWYLLDGVIRSNQRIVTVDNPPYGEQMFWMGYLYRYWNYLTGETSKQIYEIAPFDVMLHNYPEYHTYSCNNAIEELKNDYKARVSQSKEATLH